MRNLAVAAVGLCLVAAGCSQQGASTTSSALPASPITTSSTTPASPATSIASPTTATTPTVIIVPGCTETVPELPGPEESLIYAACDFDTSRPYPLVRDPLPGLSDFESALTLLVRGTTAPEQQHGLMVGFDWLEPSDAQAITVHAAIDGVGTVHIEFMLDGETWHPGTLAGTSFQVFAFVDPLYATIFQFPEVTGIGPGSLCWGELDCTQIFTRGMWESMVSINSPIGTVTCAELERDFPLRVDDHRIDLDRGLVSYHRASGADSVEEIFVQFLDDATCTADSKAWTLMISPLLDAESLYRSGHLCDFYSSLREADPPPANGETVLDQLGDAERLCS